LAFLVLFCSQRFSFSAFVFSPTIPPMSNIAPLNDLDRAIMGACRSHSGKPEFYRQLAEGELWFLLPFHPEVEGEVLELKNGSPLPFAMLEDKQGLLVPLFSSEARLEEGLKKGKVPDRTYSAAAMPAVQLLEILGKAGLRAILNKSCATGQIVIPPDLMRDLADGTALTPMTPGPREHGKVKILDPADYPTNLIQPVFELLRRHRNFRAAWIFSTLETEPQPAAGRAYRMLILMEPHDDAMFHNLNITVQSARSQTDDVQLGLADESDVVYIAKLFAQAPPFYIAADYGQPPPPH
jgi:hypothetical protein